MSRAIAENLRKQLQRQFPQAHRIRLDVAAAPAHRQAFDPTIFPCGKVSEIVPTGCGSGLSLVLAALLGEPDECSAIPELVLVDASDRFDPSSYPASACSRLLWVRCSSALEMIRAADLLVHDGNMPMAILDTTGLSRAEMTSIPPSSWCRLAQRVEANGIKLVVMSPFPWISAASARFSLSADLTLADFDELRTVLWQRLQVTPERLRNAK